MKLLKQNLRKYLVKIISLPYISKNIIFIADLLIVAGIFTFSYFICHFLTGDSVIYRNIFLLKFILCIVLSGLFFHLFSTHKRVLRYSTFKDAIRIFLSLFCSNIALFFILSTLYNYSTYLLVEIFLNFIWSTCSIFSYRVIIRLFYDYVKNTYTERNRLPLLIYGTSSTQIGLAKMIRDNEYLPYMIAGFISSDKQAKQIIMNSPVYSKNDFLFEKRSFEHVKALLINLDELEPNERQMLVERSMQSKIELLSAPPLDEWKNLENREKRINKIQIEDLLGRAPIQIDLASIFENLKEKTILITGAAGSIGGEIVWQLSQFNVGTLLLCDIAETPLHQLSLKLKNHFPKLKSQLLIADVRDYARMKWIFETYRPHYVYHAAAYKHVPLMEEHPSEAVLTNVKGTKNVADLAVAYEVECFVMISTDKAVNPSNVMGASKRIAEIYIQYLNEIKRGMDSPVRFITTRFGNVLGSNGSVIPLFADQIANGGPITVTHPDITRYFMTIPEACSLVLEASNFGKGGEIFVFDMGEPVKIKEMAESMIRLSGLEPGKDIQIVFSGLRPGEKLFEELLYDKEKVQPTHNKKIMIGAISKCDYDKIIPLISQLTEISAYYNQMKIVKVMKEIVPEFISHNSIFCTLE